MYVHSCCCILCSCIVWFEITFQNELNLHSKFGWKLEKEKEKDFSSLPSIPACWPSPWPVFQHGLASPRWPISLDPFLAPARLTPSHARTARPSSACPSLARCPRRLFSSPPSR